MNTNYIFGFGKMGSGKSIFLGMTSLWMNKNGSISYNPHNSIGKEYSRMVMDALSMNLFPGTTNDGVLETVDILFTKEKISIPITVIDMSGEELVTKIRKNVAGFSEKFDKYIQDDDTKIILLFTFIDAKTEKTSTEWRNEGYVMLDFINQVDRLCQFKNKKVALIASTNISSKPDEKATQFVKEQVIANLPQIAQQLDRLNGAIFPMIIGETTERGSEEILFEVDGEEILYDNKYKIKNLILENHNEIMKWILGTLLAS